MHELEAQSADLFDVEKDGRPRLPRVLSKTYKHGHANIVKESLRLGTSSMLVAAGKVAWHNAGGQESLKSWALAELGSLLNIKRVCLA